MNVSGENENIILPFIDDCTTSPMTSDFISIPGGQNSSVDSVLGLLSCSMQLRGFLSSYEENFSGKGIFSLAVNMGSESDFPKTLSNDTWYEQITKTECGYLNGWIKEKNGHICKISPKMVNARDIAGQRRRRRRITIPVAPNVYYIHQNTETSKG